MLSISIANMALCPFVGGWTVQASRSGLASLGLAQEECQLNPGSRYRKSRCAVRQPTTWRTGCSVTKE